MDNDDGRLADGRHARRPHSAHSDGTRLCYPFAAGGTDKDDDDFVDDQDEPEEMAVEQSSQVPVTPSVHQTTLSSFRIKANPTNVACQLLELSEEQLQEFAASRNTRKFAPIISKLICFQMSLTERFETLRLEEERVSATPAKPVSQTLLSPLVPATSPRPSDAPASEVWITPQQMPAPTVMPAVQNSAPLQVDVEDETVRKRSEIWLSDYSSPSCTL